MYKQSYLHIYSLTHTHSLAPFLSLKLSCLTLTRRLLSLVLSVTHAHTPFLSCSRTQHTQESERARTSNCNIDCSALQRAPRDTYNQGFVSVFVRACVCAYVRTCVHACVRMCVNACLRAYVRACMRVHVFTCVLYASTTASYKSAVWCSVLLYASTAASYKSQHKYPHKHIFDRSAQCR